MTAKENRGSEPWHGVPDARLGGSFHVVLLEWKLKQG